MSWLDDRTPSMPHVFRTHMVQEAGEEGTVEGLTKASVAEVLCALVRPGRDRMAAFHLLASDAYASYACEAAVQAETVEPVLLEILETMQLIEN